MKPTVTIIDGIIHIAAQKLSAHQAGERCDLRVALYVAHRLPSQPHHFEYTGEIAPVGSQLNGWYADNAIVFYSDYPQSEHPHEILRLVIDMPQSAHAPGDPFDEQWEYAGEVLNEIPEGTAFVSFGGNNASVTGGRFVPNKSNNNGYREILRPREPKFKVGDVVVGRATRLTYYHAFIVKEISHDSYIMGVLKGGDIFPFKPEDCRQATPEEIEDFYTVDLPDGVRVRAFRTSGEAIRLLFVNAEACLAQSSPLRWENEAICKALNIPICDGERVYPKPKVKA